jgi:hypothetical protein
MNECCCKNCVYFIKNRDNGAGYCDDPAPILADKSMPVDVMADDWCINFAWSEEAVNE